jgi:hypothetical protein
MLFPNLGPQYYDQKDKGILSRMEAFYASSITINQSFWSEADTDTSFGLICMAISQQIVAGNSTSIVLDVFLT